MLAMLAQVAVPTWAAIVPLIPVAALLAGLGRVLQRLDTISTEHGAARAESKAQHEETRREIAALREARVAADASVEHLRADVDALKDAMRDMRADVATRDRAQSDARHDQTNAFAAIIRQAVATEIAAQEAARAARPGRRG